ncbi:hypothetical protein CR513_20600, partial [Mucuna pruriens]
MDEPVAIFISIPELSTDISASSSNIFAKPGQMENNDRTLKELATLDVVYQPWRGPPQAFEGIPRGLFHNETTGNLGRLHQDDGVPILTQQSCKGLYFYEGLSMMDKSMIDAASGGALMDKTPAVARHLISNMASNTQ